MQDVTLSGVFSIFAAALEPLVLTGLLLYFKVIPILVLHTLYVLSMILRQCIPPENDVLEVDQTLEQGIQVHTMVLKYKIRETLQQRWKKGPGSKQKCKFNRAANDQVMQAQVCFHFKRQN